MSKNLKTSLFPKVKLRQYDQFAPVIGAKIKEAVADEGLRPEELAEKLEVSLQQVYRYFSGANLTFEALYNIAAICHRPLTSFLTAPQLEGKVAEEPEDWYRDKNRVELIQLVKSLVRTADDGVINALLENARQFGRIKPDKDP